MDHKAFRRLPLNRAVDSDVNVLAVGAFTKILEVTKTWIDFGSGKPCNI